MQFQEILKAYRIERELTQRELANACGLSQSNISAWEKGERLPLPDGLIKLADFFECSVDELLGRDASNAGTKSFIDYEILSSYTKLSDADKNKVKGYIDCLSNRK